MKKKLDSESLGIILLNAFMDEFFPKEESSTPDMFTLTHYNGLPQSNVSGQVRSVKIIYAQDQTEFFLFFNILGAVSHRFRHLIRVRYKICV